jgi:hypothetical protein
VTIEDLRARQMRELLELQVCFSVCLSVCMSVRVSISWSKLQKMKSGFLIFWSKLPNSFYLLNEESSWIVSIFWFKNLLIRASDSIFWNSIFRPHTFWIFNLSGHLIFQVIWSFRSFDH